jgi:hypothetical protein
LSPQVVASKKNNFSETDLTISELAIANLTGGEKSLKALRSKTFENYADCSVYLRNVGFRSVCVRRLNGQKLHPTEVQNLCLIAKVL